MKHELKTRLQYFKASWAGVKQFEIRNNDRKFELHDEIVLQEYNHFLTDTNGAYTGREIHGFITYITDYNQKEGYVVFSYSESHRVDE